MKDKNQYKPPRLAAGIVAFMFAFYGITAWAAPKLVIDEPVFDFGTQDNRQTIKHTFEIRNEGTSPLHIENIRSSCGCTVGEVSRRVLEPGETSRIEAAYNLRGRRGRQHSTLTLETNDPTTPRSQLVMRGAATEELRIQPGHLFFGPLTPGEEASRLVEIIGQPDQPFTLTDHEADLAGVRVETEALSPHAYRLQVFYTPEGAAGLQNGTLRVQTTHPRYRQLSIALAAQVTGGLTYAPRSLTLVGTTTTPVTRYVVLQSPGGEDFDITDVEVPMDDIQVRILRIPGRGHRLQLTHLRALPEMEGTSLRIKTTDTNHPEIEIPFEIIHP